MQQLPHQQKLLNYESGANLTSNKQKHLLITTNANQSFNNKRYTTTTATSTAATPTNFSVEVVTDDVRNNNLPSSSLASYAFYHQTSSPSPPPPIPPSLSSTAKNNNNSNININNKKQTLERRNSLISLNSQNRTPMHISVDDNIIHVSNNHTMYQITNSYGNNGGKRSPAMIYQHYQMHNNSQQQRQNYATSLGVTTNDLSDSMSMLDNDNFNSSVTQSSKSQSKLTNPNKFYHSPPLPPLLLPANAQSVSHQMSPKSIKYATGVCDELSPRHQNHYSKNNKHQYEWIESTGVNLPEQSITISKQPGLGGYWMQLENNERIWCTTDSK